MSVFDNSDPRKMSALMALSWLGMAVHNRFELPQLPLYRWEYLFPALLSFVLFIAWWRYPRGRRLWGWLILAWAGLHFIVGGVLSVLPLPIWPFSPEQSAGHYFSHLIYCLAQVPLLGFLWTRLRTDSRQGEMNAG